MFQLPLVKTLNPVARYSDEAIASELVHNDARLQKRVRWFFRAHRKAIRRFVVQNGGTSRQASRLLEDGMVGLFHQLKENGMPATSLAQHYTHICQYLWQSRAGKPQERNFYHPHLHEEKALEKLFARLGHSCEQVLKAYYYEPKTPEEIAKQFGKPYTQLTAEKKWQCLARLKELLVKDEDLLHEIHDNLEVK